MTVAGQKSFSSAALGDIHFAIKKVKKCLFNMQSLVKGRRKAKEDNVKVEEKNIVLKSGRSCTTRSNNVNAMQMKLGNGFAEEKIGENKLVESNNDGLVKSAGKTRSGKKKVKETEVDIDSQNSDQATKSSPAKRGSKKATVEPTTLEENKTSENAIAGKEISTSKHGKRNAKNEKDNKKIISENVEEKEKGNKKPRGGRKRKVEEELDKKQAAIEPSTINNQIVERNKTTENVIAEKKISTSKRGKKDNKKLLSEIAKEKKESKIKPHIGRRRKVEDESAEIDKNENDGFNLLKDEKILKVVLKRNEAIDKLLMEQIKEEKERAKTAGGAKQPEAGKSGKPDDEETGNDHYHLKLSSWNINGVRAGLEQEIQTPCSFKINNASTSENSKSALSPTTNTAAEYVVYKQSKEYVVEKIFDSRCSEYGIEYYVKWKGLNKSYNSWESSENLRCTRKIKNFERKKTYLQTRPFSPPQNMLYPAASPHQMFVNNHGETSSFNAPQPNSKGYFPSGPICSHPMQPITQSAPQAVKKNAIQYIHPETGKNIKEEINDDNSSRTASEKETVHLKYSLSSSSLSNIENVENMNWTQIWQKDDPTFTLNKNLMNKDDVVVKEEFYVEEYLFS